MAKNKIQFQKGISFTDFMNQYGTEKKCHDAFGFVGQITLPALYAAIQLTVKSKRERYSNAAGVIIRHH